MIKTGVRAIIYKILSLINCVCKKELVVFTSTPNYSDSTFTVFECLYKKKLELKYVWLLENDDRIYKYDGVTYVKRHSLKGLYYFFRAKYVFHTHGLYLNATSRKQKVFSLWHGMPIKKVQHLFPKDMINIANRKLSFELTIATSIFMAEKMASCFNCSLDKVKITGLPRNDLLFKCNKFLRVYNNEKVIVWMPTYRDGNAYKEGIQYSYGIPLIDNTNIVGLNDFCKGNNIKLLIKLHPFQKSAKGFPVMSNVLLIDSDIVDTNKHFYSYLGSSDALLTDYSSVYIDYLAIDKPIGFVLDDFNKYGDDRGFVFENPLEYMPGWHIYNFEDLKMFIYEIANGIDSTKKLRDTIGMKLNQFRDDKNTERFLNVILPIIKGGKND